MTGNIIGIYNEDGKEVARYIYDAYGNHEVLDEYGIINNNATFIGNINPFRYKGYYYNSKIYRWILPDSIEYLNPENINGLNLYVYCMNDPIMYYDPSGHNAILIGLIIGTLIGFGTAVYIDYRDDGQIFNGSVAWYDYLGATVLGGAIDAGLGAFAGMSFSATIPTGFAMIQTTAGTVTTGSMALTITCAKILVALGIAYMFSKGGLPNNKHQNQQWAEAMRQLGMENRDL